MPRGPQKRRADPSKEAEQRHARAELGKVLKEHRSVVAAAKALGVSAGLVSEGNAGTKTIGPKLVRAIATLRGTSIDEVLGRPRPRFVYKPDRYPNLEKAIALVGELEPDVLELVRSIAMHAEEDLTVGEWVDEIERWARRLARQRRTGDQIGRPLHDEDDTPPAGRA